MMETEKAHLQERSRRSAEEILDAAATVIAVDGFPAFTMNSVAEMVDGSVGRVYARYPNKEALLFAIKDRTYRRLEKKVETEVSKKTTVAGVITALVTTVSTSFFAAPRLYSFIVSHSADDPRLHGRGFEFHKRIRCTFLNQLHECGVIDDGTISNVYEMVIQSLLMRVISLGVVTEEAIPYPGFPTLAEYEKFLISTAIDVLDGMK